MDQGPATLSFEVGQRGHRPVDLPHQVHVYDPRELLRGDLLEGGDHGRGLAVLGLNLLHEGAQSRFAPGRDHDPSPLAGEPEGRLAAYAAGGPHQHHYLLTYRLELHHNHSSYV